MNAIHPFFRSAFLFLCGVTFAAQTLRVSKQPSSVPAKPGTLQVQVNVPPSWQPMFEGRITEAFVSYIIDVFRRQGCDGDIVEVRWFEEPIPGCSLLTINLTEWRMNHVGNIDCMFTGIFSGMAFRWLCGPGRFGLSDAFGDAAEDTIRQLYFALAKTELVPGVRAR